MPVGRKLCSVHKHAFRGSSIAEVVLETHTPRLVNDCQKLISSNGMLTVRATRSLNPVQYYNPAGFFSILKVALELSTPKAVGSAPSYGRRTLMVGLSICANSAHLPRYLCSGLLLPLQDQQPFCESLPTGSISSARLFRQLQAQLQRGQQPRCYQTNVPYASRPANCLATIWAWLYVRIAVAGHFARGTVGIVKFHEDPHEADHQVQAGLRPTCFSTGYFLITFLDHFDPSHLADLGQAYEGVDDGQQ